VTADTEAAPVVPGVTVANGFGGLTLAAGGSPAAVVRPAPGPTAAAPRVATVAGPAETSANALRLRFSALSWIEVVQADGQVLLSQNAPAGSEQALAGRPPLRVHIGNAAGVALEFRGRAVDLKPHTHENVARLTLE
jgi:cytoskeleton protein RodZ